MVPSLYRSAMRSLALVVLLLLVGCQNPSTKSVPAKAPISGSTGELTGGARTQRNPQPLEQATRGENLIPPSIPTEVLDLLFHTFFTSPLQFSRSGIKRVCLALQGRIHLLGMTLTSIRGDELALTLLSERCAATNVDRFLFHRQGDAWILKAWIVEPEKGRAM